MGFRGPYCLQAHVWSAILENRNVVGLAPAQGGKTLAYVAPLVSMLADREKRVTNNLNRLQSTYLLNQSPTVIVLCSTRRNVKVRLVINFLQTVTRFLLQCHSFRAVVRVNFPGGPPNILQFHTSNAQIASQCC